MSMEKQAEYSVEPNLKQAQNIIRPFDKQWSGWQVNIHAVFFDYIISDLKPSEFIVLVYMIRKIQSWGKTSDRISHNLIVKETMINSKQTVSTAIKGLAEKGMIIKNRELPREVMTYSLNIDFELRINNK